MDMDVKSPEVRERLKNRLSRIEGQVRGVQRMIDEGRDCRAIIQQLSAVRQAVHQVGLEMMRVYASQCLLDDSGAAMSEDEMLDYIIGTLGKWA